MKDRIIRLPEVMARTGLARTTLYMLEKRGGFPHRVRLGARAVGWHEVDVNAWLAARPSPD